MLLDRHRARKLAAFGVAMAMSLAVVAQNVTQYDEEGQLFRGRMEPTAYGFDLFGEKVNVYNGSLEFVQQDVSLPGNSALQVAVGRRYTTGAGRELGWHFGDWDLEIPRISVVMATKSNWQLDGTSPESPSLRCKYFSNPEIPTLMNNGEMYLPTVPVVQMYVPGFGDQELLVRSAGYADAPADGFAYPLVTKGGWQIRCLNKLATGSPLAGEGFLARAPDGTTYQFDWMASRKAKPLDVPAYQNQIRSTPVGVAVAGARLRRTPPVARVVPRPGISPTGPFTVLRSEFWLLPTRVTDRFGNSVTYTYSTTVPGQLLSIEANDGRRLTFGYGSGSAVITSVSDGTRTWLYQYTSNALSRVQLPDASAWQFQGDSLQMRPSPTNFTGEMPSCGGGPAPTVFTNGAALTRTMVHPSGAVGQFATRELINVRSYVGYCSPGWSYPPQAQFFTRALVSKTLSGPGLGAQTWTYTYPLGYGGYQPCTGCPDTKTVQVTDPMGHVTAHVYGTRWMDTEGLLLALHEGWNNGTALRSTTYRYRAAGAGPYASQNGLSSAMARGDADSQTLNRPQDKKVITQQGATFSWEATVYDGRERPARTERIGPSGTRTETHTYSDNPALWTMGQKASVTDIATGLVVEQNQYDPATAAHTASFAFGWRTGKWDYNGDGTVWHAYDAADRATTYSSYKRGIATSIRYPDGAEESADVHDIGVITRHTNPASTTRTFEYDAMGRLAKIVYPTGDAAAYYPTSLTFQQSTVAAVGLPAGHWKQTVVTGNQVTERYYDALWRALLTRKWDAANPTGTMSVVQTRYDLNGHKSFQSTPQRDIPSIGSSVDGTWHEFDALGREWRQQQSSELGWLVTTTNYLSGFTKQVINPRNYATTYGYQAWDQPSEDHIATIAAPEGVAVNIVRDLFGKPRSISRGGVTRSYVYDGFQRLCKTIEPESGATVQAYDSAGNKAWSSSGLSLPGTGSCDQGSVPDSGKVTFGYDLRNRLTSTTYGDGSPAVARTYTPDGLLESITAYASNTIRWTYAYNNRRKLTQEQYSWGDPNNWWTFQWGVDAHGNVSSLTDPWGAMSYAPNALGQPTQVSGYASNVSHHPSGAVAGYTLANGVTYALSLNARGLPEVMQHGSVVRDRYSYDANGNVTAIADEAGSGASRTMPLYDGLDRLRQANGPWGSASFGYDAVDNLVASTVGGRSLSHNIDGATNRLTSLTGSQSLSIGYDPNGNVVQRGAQTFAFDIGNRMRSAAGKASYLYDGHGRRNLVFFANGDYMHQAYTQDGKQRFGWRQSDGGARRYVYLGQALIAETAQGGVTTYSHTDALGSPVAVTGSGGAVSYRTRYEPYGATVVGSTNPPRIGFTGHVNDPDTGLVYMQQRYYEPLAGRFLSVDPVTTNAKSGGHFNRYAYAENNPYGYVDPDGRASSPIPDEVLGGSGRVGRDLARGADGRILPVSVPEAQATLRQMRAEAPAPITGNAQVTKSGGIPTTHGSTSARLATEAAASPNAKSVHLNQTIKTITGGQATSNVRPDVATVRVDGKVNVTEVLSPGQSAAGAIQKNERALGDLAGTIKAVKAD